MLPVVTILKSFLYKILLKNLYFKQKYIFISNDCYLQHIDILFLLRTDDRICGRLKLLLVCFYNKTNVIFYSLTHHSGHSQLSVKNICRSSSLTEMFSSEILASFCIAVPSFSGYDVKNIIFYLSAILNLMSNAVKYIPSV